MQGCQAPSVKEILKALFWVEVLEQDLWQQLLEPGRKLAQVPLFPYA